MSQDNSPAEIQFTQLGLAKPILAAIASTGYETPTPIQAQTIPPVLAGSDVIGQAQTGTGKTAAFALPLLSRLDLKKLSVQILVLAPTRELAIQVAEAFQVYAAHLKGFHVVPVYGGQEIGGQLRHLKRGAHVIVGTPGRIMDHMRRKSLRLEDLQCLVLDEADEMLRMGFIEDVEWILERTPSGRQIALFSATMPPAIRKIAERHLKDPEVISTRDETATAATIEQRYWMVKRIHKLDALTRILETEPFDGMIVFVRTRVATTELATKLQARGFEAAALNGEIAQKQRERTIDRFRKGKLDILVATDVAARGLDVERVSHVINYDIPYDTESYIHRIGRTGRAGRQGVAMLFVSPRERRMLRTIENATKQPISVMQLPSQEAVHDIRITKFKEKISETLQSQDLTRFRDIVTKFSHDADSSIEEVAAALAFLAQSDIFQAPTLYAAEEHSTKPATRTKRTRKPAAAADEGFARYRVEVGYTHGVKPKNIVGAIANEAGIDFEFIGRIEIYDDYSTVDLPEGMPKDVMRTIGKIRVVGQPLKISFDTTPVGERSAKVKKRKPKKASPKSVSKAPAKKRRKKAGVPQ